MAGYDGCVTGTGMPPSAFVGKVSSPAIRRIVDPESFQPIISFLLNVRLQQLQDFKALGKNTEDTKQALREDFEQLLSFWFDR